MSAESLWWGLAKIGSEVGVTPKGAAKMIMRGDLPAGRIGRRWVSSPRIIEEGILARLKSTALKGEESGG